MKSHNLKLTELQEWLITHETIYATDGKKKLVLVMLGGFKLYLKGEVVWQGMQPYAAIEKYNSL